MEIGPPAPKRRLPDAIFVGPDKAGSTWIFNVLAGHQQVFVPPAKDLYFFDSEWHRGLSWYARFFLPAAPHQQVVELSHDYLFDQRAAERIQGVLPRTKIMACFREPVARSVSAYLYLVRTGRKIGNFEQAIDRYPYLIERSAYASYLDRYLERFPVSQMHLMVFDDLLADSLAFANSILEFLEVAPVSGRDIENAFELPAASPRNRILARSASRGAAALRYFGRANLLGQIKQSAVVRQALYANLEDSARPALDPGLRRELMNHFRPSVERLSTILDRDLSSEWGYS